MSTNFFKVNRGLSLAPQTQYGSSDPSDGIDGDIYYNTTLNAFRGYKNGMWENLGAGTGGFLNYITNPDAEANLNGWSLYQNTAANIPSTGTGGTPTGLTFTRDTASPLIGLGSFLLTQANSTDVQGEGVSTDFIIDPAYQANILAVTFNYNASSTFQASDGATVPLNDGTTSFNSGNSDVEVFIYDITNAVLLPVVPEIIVAKGSNNFSFAGIFQTSTNSLNYRLILHCATSNANATGWQFKFDNIFVGPQVFGIGSTSISPTVSIATTSSFSGGFNGTTYSPPSGCSHIKVNMIGGGGGGGAGGAGGGSAGGSGVASTFGLSTAAPGSFGGLGGSGLGVGGAGGTVLASTIGADVTFGEIFPGSAGSPGGAGGNGNASSSGGNGGPGIWGTGAGTGAAAQNSFGLSASSAGAANTGAGGGGGGNTVSSSSGGGGGGGGSGATLQLLINSLKSNYAYTVGTGGTAGSPGDSAGAAGGSGIIIVEEFYVGSGGNTSPSKAPTVQVLSGSGTYTLPSGPTPLYIEVEMVGGGGGGGGGQSTAVGVTGGTTSFGTVLSCAGGAGGLNLVGDNFAAATGTINPPAIGFTIPGAPGTAGAFSGNNNDFLQGGMGGSTPLGGGGGGANDSQNGGNAPAGSGAGGGGGGDTNNSGRWTGSGGNSGAYIKATISSPSPSYAFTVGAGGAGGNGGSVGGTGGTGSIIVREYYPAGAIPATISQAPVIRVLSGSGTYTAPYNASYIKVKMTGGGGGGGSQSGGSTAGTLSTFGSSLLTANGGGAGTISGGGSGGTAIIGAGATGYSVSGGDGGGGGLKSNSGSGGVGDGGSGGANPLGGAGAAGGATNNSGAGINAGAGTPTTGAGGGGGAWSNTGNVGASGGGGGAGGYIEAIIANPATVSAGGMFAYVVGSGGTGASAGSFNSAGGAGATGTIIVEEHYVGSS